MPDLPTDVRALTVKQPWASLITVKLKTVENRTWTPTTTGPLLIHAGSGVDRAALDRAQVIAGLGMTRIADLPRGAIVAVVHSLTWRRDCSPLCSPWALADCWHWQLGDVTPLPHSVPATGRLGLWRPDGETLSAVQEQLQEVDRA